MKNTIITSVILATLLDLIVPTWLLWVIVIGYGWYWCGATANKIYRLSGKDFLAGGDSFGFGPIAFLTSLDSQFSTKEAREEALSFLKNIPKFRNPFVWPENKE